MIRPSPAKVKEQTQLSADVEAFLARGGEVEELPGFGVAPRITEVSGLRFSLNTSNGKDNSLSAELQAAIDADLATGMGTVEVARKWKVGTSTVTRRKDSLISKGVLSGN